MEGRKELTRLFQGPGLLRKRILKKEIEDLKGWMKEGLTYEEPVLDFRREGFLYGMGQVGAGSEEPESEPILVITLNCADSTLLSVEPTLPG
ncbi:MAG: hypothetical protein HY998_02315 [candidate division NC10 bacterium]|nr:hypothetical protein [candidate division NC10 bacterium]